MDFDAEMTSKIPAKDWKLVGGKQKLHQHKETIQTSLPASLECQNQTQRVPNTTHITRATTKEGPTSSIHEKGNETKIKTQTEQRHT